MVLGFSNWGRSLRDPKDSGGMLRRRLPNPAEGIIGRQP